MKIYFVRHGETTFNLHKVLMGSTGDEELDQHGIEQAQELAEKVSAEKPPFDIIFASPLHRARKTAMIISEKLQVPLEFKENIAERDYGHLEGKTYQAIHEETGHDFPYLEKNLDFDVSQFDGENTEHLKNRLLSFLTEMKEKYADKKVLVVTHKGIIYAMYHFFPQSKFHSIENASLHEFEI